MNKIKLQISKKMISKKEIQRMIRNKQIKFRNKIQKLKILINKMEIINKLIINNKLILNNKLIINNKLILNNKLIINNRLIMNNR